MINRRPLDLPHLHQKGIVIWLWGLSGSGKTTIAHLLRHRLSGEGYISLILDGDILRQGMNKDLSFDKPDRTENIRRAAEMAKLLIENGIIVICAIISPLREHRELARSIINEVYFEAFIDCPLSICEQRDVKGLYRKARKSEILNFTGIHDVFEPSQNSDLILHTNTELPIESMEKLYNKIIAFVNFE